MTDVSHRFEECISPLRDELVMENLFRGYLGYNILYPQCLDCNTYKRIKSPN